MFDACATWQLCKFFFFSGWILTCQLSQLVLLVSGVRTLRKHQSLDGLALVLLGAPAVLHLDGRA